MDWPTVRANILQTIAACVRVDTYWRDREQDMVRVNEGNESDVICKLHVLASGSNGRDDFRRELNTGTNMLDVTQAGNRRFTVSCLCESFDQGDAKTSLNYVERVRDCVMRPKVLALFRAVDITVTGVGTPVDVSYVFDGRQVSAASVDVSFAAVINEHSADANQGPGLEPDGWIETVIPLDFVKS